MADETSDSPPPPNSDQKNVGVLSRQTPPLLSKVSLAGYVYGLKGMLATLHWLRDWSEYFSPPADRPDIIKTYECRPALPVR